MRKRSAQSSSPKRLVPKRQPGIDRAAKFWRGETAEKLVAERVAANLAEKARKAEERAAKRKTRTPRAPGEKRPKSANHELRRLQRALTRRKTLAARQRVQARIDQLKADA